MSRCSIRSKEFKEHLNQRRYEREVEKRLEQEQIQQNPVKEFFVKSNNQ